MHWLTRNVILAETGIIGSTVTLTVSNSVKHSTIRGLPAAKSHVKEHGISK